MYARLIGRLRHRISDLHHAPDPAALSRAVERAVGTLHHLCDLEAEITPSADDLAAAAAAASPAAAAASSAAAAAAAAAAAGSGPPPPPRASPPRPSPLRVALSDIEETATGGGGTTAPATGAGGGGGAAGGGGGGGAHLRGRPPPPPRPAPSAKLAAGGELHALCARCRPASARCAKRLAPLALPSHLSRHWVSYCAGGAALAAAATWALRSHTLLPLLRAWCTAAVDSASSFWREHVRAPAAMLWRELVHRDYLQISDPRAAQRSSELLHELLAQFKETWASELQAAELRASAPASEDIGWAAAVLAAPAQGAAAAAQGAAAAAQGAGDAAAAVYGAGDAASAAVYGAGEAAVAAIQRRASDGVHPGAAVAAGAAAAQAASEAASEAIAAAAATTAATEAATAAASGASRGAAAVMPRLIDIDAEMEAISRLFGMQLQSPAYNMVQGPLLQMLIIQAAYAGHGQKGPCLAAAHPTTCHRARRPPDSSGATLYPGATLNPQGPRGEPPPPGCRCEAAPWLAPWYPPQGRPTPLIMLAPHPSPLTRQVHEGCGAAADGGDGDIDARELLHCLHLRPRPRRRPHARCGRRATQLARRAVLAVPRHACRPWPPGMQAAGSWAARRTLEEDPPPTASPQRAMLA
jgi:hypothetical protein